jgi:hypothetical protein
MPYGIIDAKLVFPNLAGLANITSAPAIATTDIKLHPGTRRGGMRFMVFVPQALAGATGLTVELKESTDGVTYTSLNPPAIYTVNAAAANDVDFPVETAKPHLGVLLVFTGSPTGSGAGAVMCALLPTAAGATGVTSH